MVSSGNDYRLVLENTRIGDTGGISLIDTHPRRVDHWNNIVYLQELFKDSWAKVSGKLLSQAVEYNRIGIIGLLLKDPRIDPNIRQCIPDHGK